MSSILRFPVVEYDSVSFPSLSKLEPVLPLQPNLREKIEVSTPNRRGRHKEKNAHRHERLALAAFFAERRKMQHRHAGFDVVRLRPAAAEEKTLRRRG